MSRTARKSLADYITARLELEHDAEGYGIRAAGVEEEVARTWDWVRTGRQQREALKQVTRILKDQRPTGDAERALAWLAAAWAADRPLVDERGRPYTANADGLTYVTECCLVIATDDGGEDLHCWSCNKPVDDVLALTPLPSSCDTPWRGDVDGASR